MANRNDYLRQLRTYLKRIYTPELSVLCAKAPRKGEWFSVGMMRHFLAYAFAVLWKCEGRASDLREAKQLLLNFPDAHTFAGWAAAGTYKILKSELTKSERNDFGERWVGELQPQMEHFCGNLDPRSAYGNNHKVMACLYADLARQLFPKHAAPYEFERITDKVWNMWWERRDFQEQGTGYEGFTEHAHCIWAKVRSVEKEFYSSPSIINMFERNMLIVTPGGMITAYGDSGYPVQPSHFPAMFEHVARGTRDGRFRQCADDIFRGCQRTGFWKRVGPVESLPSMPQYLARKIYRNFTEDAMAMADAALNCDERVKLKPRPYAGVIRRLPKNEVLKKGERGGGHIKPDRYNDQQVAMIGGKGKKKTYMLLSVGRELGHDHPDAGSIQLLAHGDTELLGTNGYLYRELYYHNTFFAQEASRPVFPDNRYDKRFIGSAACYGEVEELATSADSSFCRLHFKNFHDLPADLTREFVVDRDGVVTMTDLFKVHKGRLRAGLIFHGERAQKLGSHAYRLRLDTLKMNDGNEIENLPGELDVSFAFGEGEVAVRNSLNTPLILDTLPAYQKFPCLGYQKFWKATYIGRRCLTFSRELAKGEEARFVTTLKPRSSV